MSPQPDEDAPRDTPATASEAGQAGAMESIEHRSWLADAARYERIRFGEWAGSLGSIPRRPGPTPWGNSRRWSGIGILDESFTFAGVDDGRSYAAPSTDPTPWGDPLPVIVTAGRRGNWRAFNGRPAQPDDTNEDGATQYERQLLAQRDQTQSVVDEIDQLVNQQLATHPNRSGYDHDVNQPRCSQCGGAWHGLPTAWCGAAASSERAPDGVRAPIAAAERDRAIARETVGRANPRMGLDRQAAAEIAAAIRRGQHVLVLCGPGADWHHNLRAIPLDGTERVGYSSSRASIVHPSGGWADFRHSFAAVRGCEVDAVYCLRGEIDQQDVRTMEAATAARGGHVFIL